MDGPDIGNSIAVGGGLVDATAGSGCTVAGTATVGGSTLGLNTWSISAGVVRAPPFLDSRTATQQ